MFCGECGNKFEDPNAKFCDECGTPNENYSPAAVTGTAVAQSYAANITTALGSVMAPPVPISAPTLAPIGSDRNLSASSYKSTNSHPEKCTQCAFLFSDPSEQFCGECGTRRPSGNAALSQPSALSANKFGAATVDDDDGGNLFGPTGGVSKQPSSNTLTATSTNAIRTYKPQDSFSSLNSGNTVTTSYTPPSLNNSNTVSTSYTSASLVTGAPMNTTGSPQLTKNKAFTTNFPAANLAAAQLAGLTVKSKQKANENVEEKHGTGENITIKSIVSACDMNPLQTRQTISNAVIRNKTSPDHLLNGYNMTNATNNITILQSSANTQNEEEAFYQANTVADNNEWNQILRQHRRNHTKFTDSQFPPNSNSLCRDNQNTTSAYLNDLVYKWKRISDFFSQTAYVEIIMVNDSKKLICSIAMKSTAEAESMLSHIQSNPTTVDQNFLKNATHAVHTGMTGQKRDHMLLLTTNFITQMGEYVHDNVTKFEYIWNKNLSDVYKPLQYHSIGTATPYRIGVDDDSSSSRIAVLVPILFQAEDVCVMDTSNCSKPNEHVGIDPGLVKQGRLANSYLFGALSILSTSPTALAQVFPDLDPDLLQPSTSTSTTTKKNEFQQVYNEEGVYAIRFWKNNQSRVAIIDDYIPCNQNGRPCFGSFTTTKKGFEFWHLLIEKAYAKLYRGYDCIIGGLESYCLQDLYGGMPLSVPFSTFQNEQIAYSEMVNGLKTGELMGCMNDNVENIAEHNIKGLRKIHAYGILKVVELDYCGQIVQLVQLRNSWGIDSSEHSGSQFANDSNKWQGPWSNEDTKWTYFSKQQKLHLNFQFKEDNTYWMEFSFFYNYFNTLIVSKNVYQYPPSTTPTTTNTTTMLQQYQGNVNINSIYIIQNAWRELTFGGREAVHLNPQYQLRNTDHTTQVQLHLEQPSRRLTNQGNYEQYIAPLVAKNGAQNERKIDLTHDIIATGTFVSNRGSYLKVSIAPSKTNPYIIIPATYDKSATVCYYALTVVTDQVSTALIPLQDDQLPLCHVCQRPLHGSFSTFQTNTSSNPNDNTSSSTSTAINVCNGECVDLYKKSIISYCVECQLAIEYVANKFSGRFFILNENANTKCHAECMDAYRIRTSESCIVCNMPITVIKGKFTGQFYTLEQNKLKCHAECYQQYLVANAVRCVQCHEPIIKIENKYNGKFYQLPNSTQQVHDECWYSYQSANAEKCKHCGHGILKTNDNKYDGRFYELNDKSGKIHFECWQDFQKQF